MAVEAKVDLPVSVQFPLYGPDGFTRLEGEASNVEATLYRSTEAGGRELLDLEVAVAEPEAGEYVATFTPDVADRTYTLILRHPQSSADIEETIQVWTATPSDIDAAVEAVASGYTVGIAGVPSAAGDPLTVTLSFHNRSTMGLISPTGVTIRLYDTDGTTLLQTKSGADVTTPEFGKRRTTFAALATPGRYFVSVTFTGPVGDAVGPEYIPADITSSGAGAIAGVMSVEELLEEYLGAISGEADITNLLKDSEGRALVSNRFMEAAIRRAAAYVGRVLETTFGTLRYACYPDLGTALEPEDYDAEVEALPWASHGRADLSVGMQTLKHSPLVEVTRMRLFVGQLCVATVPLAWVAITSKRNAQFSVIPSGPSSIDITQTQWAFLATGNFLALDTRPSGTLPAVWAIDYVAGLASVPEDIKAAIGWRAAAEVLAAAAVKANKAAVQSQSVSMDGVSRSQGVSDSQPGGRYARLLQTDHVKMWTDPTDAALLKLKLRHTRGAMLL